ncbi:MAG: hypothetical protein CMM56_05805 [Rhodospirillaceae bacterium]|nr:hypothetical protein [Rhodospirillaceae bacterium]
MIRSITIFLILLMSISSGWTSEAVSKSKHESLGIGSGAAIGALAGGPVGLVFGAAMGAFVGDILDMKHVAQFEYERKWTKAQAEVRSLNALIKDNGFIIASLEAELQENDSQMQSSVTDALDIKVLFTTNESKLPDITESRLVRLSELLARLDNTMIRIDGHTDARGSLLDNKQLAEERVAAVKEALVRGGVPASRVIMNAHGEAFASAEENDVDAMAMERRVDLTLIRNTQNNRVAQQ